MSTLEELESQKAIFRLSMKKIAPQKREIWILPGVADWMNGVLPKLRSFYDDEQASPMQQAYNLLGGFIRGDELYETEDFWLMRPASDDVFELKSPDLRFFGWFNKPKVYLIVAADTFENTHANDLHNGYRDMVVRERKKLDLNEPKVIVGAEPSDVF